ncbi:MAG: DUF1653 domain-containing protein [Pseudomonadota bacterium]
MIQLRRLFQPQKVTQAQTWAATHRHRKGGLYRLIDQGVYEPDRSLVAIYDDAEGTVWVRPWSEFQDGRFTPVTG